MEKKKQLFIVQHGLAYQTIKTDDLAMIYTLNEKTCILTREGKKRSFTENLNKLERELDHRFFRANRQTIIHVDFIRSFQTFDNTKLRVDLLINHTVIPVLISQSRAPRFMEWMATF